MGQDELYIILPFAVITGILLCLLLFRKRKPKQTDLIEESSGVHFLLDSHKRLEPARRWQSQLSMSILNSCSALPWLNLSDTSIPEPPDLDGQLHLDSRQT